MQHKASQKLDSGSRFTEAVILGALFVPLKALEGPPQARFTLPATGRARDQEQAYGQVTLGLTSLNTPFGFNFHTQT